MDNLTITNVVWGIDGYKWTCPNCAHVNERIREMHPRPTHVCFDHDSSVMMWIAAGQWTCPGCNDVGSVAVPEPAHVCDNCNQVINSIVIEETGTSRQLVDDLRQILAGDETSSIVWR